MKATIVKLTDTTREFLKKLNFPEIPNEAKFIAFTEDGDAQFFEELEIGPGFIMPKMAVISYYEVPDMTFEL